MFEEFRKNLGVNMSFVSFNAHVCHVQFGKILLTHRSKWNMSVDFKVLDETKKKMGVSFLCVGNQMWALLFSAQRANLDLIHQILGQYHKAFKLFHEK